MFFAGTVITALLCKNKGGVSQHITALCQPLLASIETSTSLYLQHYRRLTLAHAECAGSGWQRAHETQPGVSSVKSLLSRYMGLYQLLTAIKIGIKNVQVLWASAKQGREFGYSPSCNASMKFNEKLKLREQLHNWDKAHKSLWIYLHTWGKSTRHLEFKLWSDSKRNIAEIGT